MTIREGWVHTGDLGRIDEAGCLRLAGRAKEMFIRGGYNVFPLEVEAVIASHPEVVDVVVVPRPDPVMGEIGVAVVVPRDPGNPPVLDDLRRDAGAPVVPQAARGAADRRRPSPHPHAEGRPHRPRRGRGRGRRIWGSEPVDLTGTGSRLPSGAGQVDHAVAYWSRRTAISAKTRPVSTGASHGVPASSR